MLILVLVLVSIRLQCLVVDQPLSPPLSVCGLRLSPQITHQENIKVGLVVWVFASERALALHPFLFNPPYSLQVVLLRERVEVLS